MNRRAVHVARDLDLGTDPVEASGDGALVLGRGAAFQHHRGELRHGGLPLRIMHLARQDDAVHRDRGDGVIREMQFLTKAQVTLLSDRRKFAPYGLNGADAGAPGVNVIILKNGTEERLPSKFTKWVEGGDVLSIQTPGGGGWGKA